MNQRKRPHPYLEHIVYWIEKSLAPGAIVLHNQRLPVVGSSSGKKRQCDIVIRSGPENRETLTIVEVQDRKSPVKIAEFEGWQKKLKQVGAQHLVCVSRHPFPESIKEQAALSGNTVKLITINTLLGEQIPLEVLNISFVQDVTDILNIHKEEVIVASFNEEIEGFSKEEVLEDLSTVKTNDQKFIVGKKVMKALATICIENSPTDTGGIEVAACLALGYIGSDSLHYWYKGKAVQLAMKIEYTYSSRLINIEPSVIAYDQLNDGTLAWMLEALYTSGDQKMWLKLPAVKHGAGLRVDSIIAEMPFPGILTVLQEKEKR
ncbi:MAG: hypothetical protein QM764_22140 [Chitinophagaceae bacterium]